MGYFAPGIWLVNMYKKKNHDFFLTMKQVYYIVLKVYNVIGS